LRYAKWLSTSDIKRRDSFVSEAFALWGEWLRTVSALALWAELCAFARTPESFQSKCRKCCHSSSLQSSLISVLKYHSYPYSTIRQTKLIQPVQYHHYANKGALERLHELFCSHILDLPLTNSAVVFTAAAKAETIIDTYPTHFYDIEEAKGYIRTTCKQAGFQYVSKRIKHEELAYVKDTVCFVVAAKAFEQGEFYLEIELEDRRALRSTFAWNPLCFPLVASKEIRWCL
jgi:hypothetical protein